MKTNLQILCGILSVGWVFIGDAQTTTNAYAQAVLADHPIVYYRFEPVNSYLVYATNNAFYAEDAVTRQFASSNTNAASLLNQLIGRTLCRAITFLPGDYPMTATLNLKSDLSLTGTNGVRLIQAGTGNLIFGTAITNCQISNLELAGGGINVSGAGIYLLTNCKSNLMSHLYVHDFNGDGILLGDPDTQYNVIIGNCVSNCIGGAGIGLGNTAGDAIIQSNIVYRTRFHGIIVSRGGSRCLIADNTVIDAGYYVNVASNDFSHGIAVDGGGGAVRGTGNIIVGNTTSNSAMAGIEVADWQNDCTIVQNKVFGTGHGHYGIYFGGGLAPSTNCIIISNFVQNAAGNGIMVDSPGLGESGITSDVVISNNTTLNSTNNGILIGIAKNVAIVGNTCKNNGMTVSSDVDGIHVQGRGSLSAQTQDITINQNRSFDDRTPPLQKYGVFVAGASYIQITGNCLEPNKTGPIYLGFVSDATVTNNDCSAFP